MMYVYVRMINSIMCHVNSLNAQLQGFDQNVAVLVVICIYGLGRNRTNETCAGKNDVTQFSTGSASTFAHFDNICSTRLFAIKQMLLINSRQDSNIIYL